MGIELDAPYTEWLVNRGITEQEIICMKEHAKNIELGSSIRSTVSKEDNFEQVN